MSMRLLLACIAGGLAAAAAATAGTFNPHIAVHLDGLYYHDTLHGDGAALVGGAGHDHHGHAHDHGGNGFSLQGAELNLWGTVDPLFDAWLSLASHDGADVAVEEAWVRTRALPHGLQLTAGRFLSAIGYHNEKHLHEWAMADQNLAHARLFGSHGLLDTGVRLTWLAPTATFLQLGLEVLQGDDLPAFGARVDARHLIKHELGDEPEHFHHDGPGLAVLFARFGPDLGVEQALQLGASVARQRSSGTWLEDDVAAAEGHSDLIGVHVVYKRFAPRAYGAGGLTLQGEWFLVDADQRIALAMDPALAGLPVRQREQAGYLQASWGFAPRWRLGLRTAVIGVGGREREAGARHRTGIGRQHSLALSWQLTEFSRLRLQFGHNDLAASHHEGDAQFNQVMLQYSLSLGAHGAHAF